MKDGRSCSDCFSRSSSHPGWKGSWIFLRTAISLPRSVSVILIFLAALIVFIVVVYTVVPFLLVEIDTIFSGVNKASLGGWGILLNLQAFAVGQFARRKSFFAVHREQYVAARPLLARARKFRSRRRGARELVLSEPQP